jgi:hypothetical protein
MKRKRSNIIDEVKEDLGLNELYFLFNQIDDNFIIIANTRVSDSYHSSFVSVNLAYDIIVTYDGLKDDWQSYPLRSARQISQKIQQILL